jgi:hypothetical protein
MKMQRVVFGIVAFLVPGGPILPQSKPENATDGVIRGFEALDVVLLGELHGNKQEYQWLNQLVETPAFAERVDDIVLEFGNSLYQKSVNRYIAGDDVPLEQVQKAWRNLVGAVGAPSPVYPSLYAAAVAISFAGTQLMCAIAVQVALEVRNRQSGRALFGKFQRREKF